MRRAVQVLLFALLAGLGFARPNIVVLVADDLGYGDLGVTGHPSMQTPHIDSLARDGAMFRQFYSPAQVCSASRASMMTGRMPHRLGIYSFIGGSSGDHVHLPKNETTVTQLLRGNGYQTALIGKWHASLHQARGQHKAIPSMDHYGFDYWFSTDDNTINRDKPNWFRNGKNEGVKTGYTANTVGREAVRWLREFRDPERPFIQFVHFYEPHWRVEAPEPLIDEAIAAGATNRNEATYFAAVHNVDREVGRLLEALEGQGIATNTVVLFTSDHGPAKLGKGHYARNYGRAAPFRGKKYGLWEGSIHVPGLVRWPARIQAGLVIDEPAGSIDWLPTLCEITGTPLPKTLELDGQSHLPLLLGKELRRAKPLQWHHYNTNFHDSPNPNAVLRSGDHVICGFYDRGTQLKRASWNDRHFERIKTGRLTRFELYKLSTDPAQRNNVAEQDPERFVSLKERLQTAHRTMQDQAVGWQGTRPTQDLP